MSKHVTEATLVQFSGITKTTGIDVPRIVYWYYEKTMSDVQGYTTSREFSQE